MNGERSEQAVEVEAVRMSDDLPALLDRLEAAAAAATPGPWQYDPSEGDTVWDADEKRPSIIALTRDPYGHCEADAALIVAAVNALPTLIAELRAHQAAVQAVRELADEFDGTDSRQAVDDALRPFRTGYGTLTDGWEDRLASTVDDARADERERVMLALDEALLNHADARTAHEVRAYVKAHL